MATLCKSVLSLTARSAVSGTRSLQSCSALCVGFRNVHTTPALLRDTHSDDDDQPRGWFSRLRKTAQPEQSHSMALSTKEQVYEIQFHIWAYPGGYPTLNHANTTYRTDKEFIELRKQRNMMLRSRRNQILLAFSFWPNIGPREGSNIYELRSYTLKPGTMYEWANCWAKGIKHRQTNNEPVAGFFAQIGNVYSVEHMWGVPTSTMLHLYVFEGGKTLEQGCEEIGQEGKRWTQACGAEMVCVEQHNK
ncbi:protein NipSnap 2 [Elysia marginata]|uniref:Protein NipSnap 2 n=1 Tax=Elysia marginata TaxID=1093978 RepID=A0AAV4G9L9_9GAST|nr:protein NipSnap 2 [Elysia marginata]